MKSIDINNADWQDVIKKVIAGKEILLSDEGKTIAKVSPYKERKTKVTKRKGGQLKGQIWIAEDFDAQDEDIVAMFEGGN